jgi:hypothetical protein
LQDATPLVWTVSLLVAAHRMKTAALAETTSDATTQSNGVDLP